MMQTRSYYCKSLIWVFPYLLKLSFSIHTFGEIKYGMQLHISMRLRMGRCCVRLYDKSIMQMTRCFWVFLSSIIWMPGCSITKLAESKLAVSKPAQHFYALKQDDQCVTITSWGLQVTKSKTGNVYILFKSGKYIRKPVKLSSNVYRLTTARAPRLCPLQVYHVVLSQHMMPAMQRALQILPKFCQPPLLRGVLGKSSLRLTRPSLLILWSVVHETPVSKALNL